MSSHRQGRRNDKAHDGDSELFTVRLWIEELDERRREYRGQVKHVVTGVTRNFREWADLEAFLLGTFDDYEEGYTWESRR